MQERWGPGAQEVDEYNHAHELQVCRPSDFQISQREMQFTGLSRT